MQLQVVDAQTSSANAHCSFVLLAEQLAQTKEKQGGNATPRRGNHKSPPPRGVARVESTRRGAGAASFFAFRARIQHPLLRAGFGLCSRQHNPSQPTPPRRPPSRPASLPAHTGHSPTDGAPRRSRPSSRSAAGMIAAPSSHAPSKVPLVQSKPRAVPIRSPVRFPPR